MSWKHHVVDSGPQPKQTESSFRGGACDSAKNHKRQRRKRQSVTAKREKSQTPKFVYRLGYVKVG